MIAFYLVSGPDIKTASRQIQCSQEFAFEA